MARRKYHYRPREVRHGEDRVKCFPASTHGGNEVCVIGHKYGFEGRLYARGHSYPEQLHYLPVSTGRARTLTAAAAGARQFLRRLREKRLR